MQTTQGRNGNRSQPAAAHRKTIEDAAEPYEWFEKRLEDSWKVVLTP